MDWLILLLLHVVVVVVDVSQVVFGAVGGEGIDGRAIPWT